MGTPPSEIGRGGSARPSAMTIGQVQPTVNPPAARAEILVTGDKDLLVIGLHCRTRIVDPHLFELLFS